MESTVNQGSLATSVLAGIAVSACCALVWALSALWARRGGSKRFVTAHLGGMAVRLGLAGGLSAWALLKLNVQIGAFVVALLGSYSLLMVAEVVFLARRRLPGGIKQ